MTVSPAPSPATMPAPGALRRRAASVALGDRLVLGALLLVAATTRFVDLPTRGTWDKDQGHDMLVLHALVHDGVVPLLGPPTSIGDVHHGAWYYYLLAPAAAISGAAPEAVVALLAAFGVTAVAVTWWLARHLGGPVAGLVAGLLMAVSATAIEQSTFIWNPNILALTSSVAFAGAWAAWSTRQPRWWLLSAAGLALTMQGHVLGAVLLPPLVVLFALDARRAAHGGPGAAASMPPADGGQRADGRKPPLTLAPSAGNDLDRRGATSGRGFLLAAVGGVAILAAAFLPLVVHELLHDFGETRAALAYLAEGGREVALGPLERSLFVGLRVLTWPLTGLVTDALVPAVAAAGFVVAILALLGRRLPPAPVRAEDSTAGSAPVDPKPLGWGGAGRRGAEGVAVRWIAGTLMWSTLALALVAPSLATVTPGLPNDHYHSFLDPLVFLTVGLGVAAVWRTTARASPALRRLGRGAAAAAVGAIVAFNVATWPPAVASDGGWPAARAAAERIVGVTGDHTLALVALPELKGRDAIEFPLVAVGARLGTPVEADALVVGCDALFEAVIGASCGGPAEDAAVREMPGWGRVLERFALSERTTVSIYRRR